MGDSLFDIFGDHITRQAVKNVSRQPLCNIENRGKTVSAHPVGPIKPNEPVKKLEKGEAKKSFLVNSGKALQSTPARQVFTPRAVNVASLIYSDVDVNERGYSKEDLEFTKPTYKLDNYHKDILDYLPMPEREVVKEEPPPNTPPPASRRHSFDISCSYEDEFFRDDFSNDSIPEVDDLGLPDIF